jgi:acetate kinase
VVHGGETFSQSVLVTPAINQEIQRLFDLAPLHNPAALMGIQAVEANIPHVPQAVVFDTAFHQTMPKTSYLYPVPMLLYRKHKVRRYGFHGTSHDYVSGRAALMVGQPLSSLKIITCHLGNGASVTAIQQGKSFDTSMGMTPLEGLMMGTRSGDIDPAIVPYIMGKEELTLNEVSSMLNKHSGLIAISGISSDMREIELAMEQGEKSAKLAFDMFEYRIRKYIGAYTAGMNGLDVLVFTAGVGENSVRIRQTICEQLTFLGIDLDHDLNNLRSGAERYISRHDSKVKVVVIPTNEEWMIAKDTHKLVMAQTTDDVEVTL